MAKQTKRISFMELLSLLPVTGTHLNTLKTCRNQENLKEEMHNFWFDEQWLDDLHHKLCGEDTADYDIDMLKSEKVDIICAYLTITDWDAKDRLTSRVVVYHKEQLTPISARSYGKPQEPEMKSEDSSILEQTPETVQSLVPHENENTLSLSKIRESMKKYQQSDFKEKEDDIDDYDFTIMEGLPITYQSNFKIKTKLEISLDCVLLMDFRTNTVIGFGRLQTSEKDINIYHLVIPCEQLDFEAFKPPHKYYVVLFDKEVQVTSEGVSNHRHIYAKSYYLGFKAVETTENTLCIDFGTSNTCAGTYGLLNTKENQVEIVKFETNQSYSELYPTVLYVDDCSDPTNICCSFGYDALDKVKEKNYNTDASVFFELKRFMGELEETEDICDEQGYTQTIPRRVLLQLYLLHIIALSEQHFKVKFKNLHFTSPVKMKSLFFKGLYEMLTPRGYHITPPEESIDEGIAIVYYNIKRIIKYSDDFNDGIKEKINIMILDCGGGTTDLASCSVEYEDMDTSKELILNSGFVNGNSNFGGNNITYKILQLIKIKLVEKLKNSSEIDLLTVIKHDENAILNISDELLREENSIFHAGLETFHQSIYGDFQKLYEECEAVIPTQFMKNQDSNDSRRDIGKKKQNYYFLWQLAEKIKIKFYETDIVSYDISGENNSMLNTTSETFYVRDSSGALTSQHIGQVSLTIKELHRLLCGDIYCLLNSLLLKEEAGLLDYTHYKLAGQSCKISLFMELLKEFIPGRRLRLNTATRNQDEDNNGSLRLKRGCIEGAILYMKDIEFGNIRPRIHIAAPTLIYDLYVKRETEVNLLSSKDPDIIKYELFNDDTKKIAFVIKNTGNTEINSFTVELSHDKSKWTPMGGENILQKIVTESHVDPNEANYLEEKLITENPREAGKSDSIIFGLPVLSKEGYGVNIYFIKKTLIGSSHEFSLYQPIYENFEDENTKSFFDGSK